MMKKGDKFYLVWNEEDADSSCHYWELFDCIEDAVSRNDGCHTEVYEAEPKRLGMYKVEARLVKMKSAKAKKGKKGA